MEVQFGRLGKTIKTNNDQKPNSIPITDQKKKRLPQPKAVIATNGAASTFHQLIANP